MIELFLIRHGESTNNALLDATQRVEDPLLTDLGMDQARRLADYVAAYKHLPEAQRHEGPVFHRLYTSAMRRSLLTTAPISATSDLQARVWIDIHEIGGIWVADADTGEPIGGTGVGPAQLQHLLPRALIENGVLTDEGWWRGAQESVAVGCGRAIEVATHLRQQACASAASERVAIVSHGDFLGALFKAFANGLPTSTVTFSLTNTSISHLTLRQDGSSVFHYFNRVEHLNGAADL